MRVAARMTALSEFGIGFHDIDDFQGCLKQFTDDWECWLLTLSQVPQSRNQLVKISLRERGAINRTPTLWANMGARA